MGEGLSLASMSIDGGFAQFAGVVTSSHFCSAERQYRTPLEYGGQRTPTAQWTVTGSGAVILAKDGPGPHITHITTGKVVDKGIKDANNMGAAMAPAAYDTLTAHFKDTGRQPDFYDLIVTGDLGWVGSPLLQELLNRHGCFVPDNRLTDCGKLIFSPEPKNLAGGSGCGCIASTACGHIRRRLARGELRRVLLVATGALLSPLSVQQKESIPGIAHAVSWEVV